MPSLTIPQINEQDQNTTLTIPQTTPSSLNPKHGDEPHEPHYPDNNQARQDKSVTKPPNPAESKDSSVRPLKDSAEPNNSLTSRPAPKADSTVPGPSEPLPHVNPPAKQKPNSFLRAPQTRGCDVKISNIPINKQNLSREPSPHGSKLLQPPTPQSVPGQGLYGLELPLLNPSRPLLSIFWKKS